MDGEKAAVHIEVPGKPTPFNQARGEKALEEVRQNFKQRGARSSRTSPRFTIAGDDTILVRKYPPGGDLTSHPVTRSNDPNHLQVYDSNSKAVELQDTHHHYHRIAGIDANWNTITTQKKSNGRSNHHPANTSGIQALPGIRERGQASRIGCRLPMEKSFRVDLVKALPMYLSLD